MHTDAQVGQLAAEGALGMCPVYQPAVVVQRKLT
jgi:hypothetical protein